jgi:hypothetical protein
MFQKIIIYDSILRKEFQNANCGIDGTKFIGVLFKVEQLHPAESVKTSSTNSQPVESAGSEVCSTLTGLKNTING